LKKGGLLLSGAWRRSKKIDLELKNTNRGIEITKMWRGDPAYITIIEIREI